MSATPNSDWLRNTPWWGEPRFALRRQLTVYFLLVFGLTWGTAAVLLLQPEFLVSRFGRVDVETPFYAAVFYAAVCVPSLTGFLLTVLYSGKQGVKDLFSRIVRWRVGPLAVFVVLGIPLYYLSTDWMMFGLLDWPRGAPHYRHDALGWLTAFFGGAILTDPGPLGEEVGWRGFAFPRLVSLLPFWKAELILGIIWGFWHIPAFYIASTGQSTLNMAWFLAGAVALSFIMGSVFLGTRGSVLYSGFIVHYFANQLPDLQGNIQVEVVRFGVLALIFFLLVRWLQRRRNHTSSKAGSSDALSQC